MSRGRAEGVKDLVQELQAMVSREESRSRKAKLLKELCNHIRRLQREVDDLSNRISGLLAPSDATEVGSS